MRLLFKKELQGAMLKEKISKDNFSIYRDLINYFEQNEKIDLEITKWLYDNKGKTSVKEIKRYVNNFKSVIKKIKKNDYDKIGEEESINNGNIDIDTIKQTHLDDLYLIEFITRFPPLNPSQVISEYIYKYTNWEGPWTSFNIRKFNPEHLNDSYEVVWYNHHINSNYRYFNVLASYTTLSETNLLHMVSNYSEIAKRRWRYNYNSTLTAFDSLNSNKTLAIKSFVRYSDDTRQELSRFIQEMVQAKINKETIHIAVHIFSFFVKASCMSEENEFRFLILTKSEISSIDLDVVPELEHCSRWNVEDKLSCYVTGHNINNCRNPNEFLNERFRRLT